MTKKHFTAAAAYVAALADRRIAAITADVLATLFAEDNPRFDRVRFLKACGL